MVCPVKMMVARRMTCDQPESGCAVGFLLRGRFGRPIKWSRLRWNEARVATSFITPSAYAKINP